MATPADSSRHRVEFVAPALIIGLAAFFLFWNLDEKYLWQDEAATAVLSVRMLNTGKPLAYDGVNLITNDNFASEDLNTVNQRTGDPKAALDYYIKRGDMKQDTAWKYQPWGQFAVTAVSLKLFGQTTFAARLPFALAGVAIVLCLYWFVRSNFNSALMASHSALLLVFNSYWILHVRQCRYYSLSSLFLVLTLISYARWQKTRGRAHAAVFVIAAWCWFQVDYGTFWPVVGVLFLDACLAESRHDLWKPFLTGLILAAAIAPFAYYYELWGRLSVQGGTWKTRFQDDLFNVNQYVVPAVVIGLALALLAWRWTKLPPLERRLVAVACALITALTLWVPTVAPASFLRYVVPAIPVGAFLSAWMVVRGLAGWAPAFACVGIALLAFTPLLSLPLHPFALRPDFVAPDSLIRPELSIAASEIFAHRADPNRIVVDWLKQNSVPTDEILINYEDVPLMFYLPNPIRGGIAAFRAEDDGKTPPRFLVIRRSVGFVHWPVFQRVCQRYHWIEVPTNAPDITWGNNPDPMGEAQDPKRANPLLIARRAD